MDSYILRRRLCIVLSRIIIVFGALLLEVALLKRQVNIDLYFYLSFLLCSWVLHYILYDCSKVLGLSTLQVISKLFLGHEVREFLGTCYRTVCRRDKSLKFEGQTGVTGTNPTQCHHNGMVLSL
jgi:hypothetical protein